GADGRRMRRVNTGEPPGEESGRLGRGRGARSFPARVHLGDEEGGLGGILAVGAYPDVVEPAGGVGDDDEGVALAEAVVVADPLLARGVDEDRGVGVGDGVDVERGAAGGLEVRLPAVRR